MITLIHGEDQTALQNQIQIFKDQAEGEVSTLEASSPVNDLLAQIAPQTLFSTTPRLIIIEGLISSKKAAEVLPHLDKDSHVILVEYKKVAAKDIPQIPTLKIQELKPDPVVFKFLDALCPNGTKKFFPLWLKYKAVESPEIILALLARQIRLLLLASENSSEGPQDWKNLAPWQKQKLRQQAQTFGTPVLLLLHQKLADIDFQNKNGLLPYSLLTALELLLLTL